MPRRRRLVWTGAATTFSRPSTPARYPPTGASLAAATSPSATSCWWPLASSPSIGLTCHQKRNLNICFYNITVDSLCTSLCSVMRCDTNYHVPQFWNLLSSVYCHLLLPHLLNHAGRFFQRFRPCRAPPARPQCPTMRGWRRPSRWGMVTSSPTRRGSG